MLTEGQEPIPGYRLEKFLGRGQFGEVWRAKSPGGTHVALKFLNVRERQGRKEFRAIQKIKGVRHPHLVQTYALWLLDDQLRVIDDVGFENASPSMLDSFRATMQIDSKQTQSSLKPSMLVIATVLCDQNLMERLQDWQQRGASGIPIPELIGYMEDAAKAIDFLNASRHELGDGPVAIHHCDIKPENIMTLGDQAVVGDFGVARILNSGGTDSRRTTMGGSIAYAPPESFENKTESTSDQYALAITYYELRTGKLPFKEETAASVMNDKQLGNLDFSGVNPKEQVVLQIATTVQPSKRYPTARQFVEALHRAALDLPLPAARKSRGLFWFAGLSLLVAAAIAYYFVGLNSKKEVRKEIPSVDPGKIFDSALAMIRQSPYDENILRQATDEAIKSMNAGYSPTMPEDIGNISMGIDSIDDDANSLVSIHPDRKSIVAGHDRQLDFYGSAGSERTTMILNDMVKARLTKLVWLADKLVMLDDHHQIRYVSLTEAPSANLESPTKIMVEAQGRPFANWADSEFRDGLLLLKGQRGTKVGFKDRSGTFEGEWWSKFDSGGKSKKIIQQSDLSAETAAYGSRNGERFLIVSQDRSRSQIAVCKLWNRPNGAVVDLKSILSESLTSIDAVRFLGDGERLVVGGESKSANNLAVLVLVQANDVWQIEKVEQYATESSVQMVIVDEGRSFYVGQGARLNRWSREGSGSWMVDEIAQFHDGLNGALVVKAIYSHPSGWLFLGREDGVMMMVKQASPQSQTNIEIVRLASKIEQIYAFSDQLLILTKDGTLAWYDLRECLLIADACLQTGKIPQPITKTPSVVQ